MTIAPHRLRPPHPLFALKSIFLVSFPYLLCAYLCPLLTPATNDREFFAYFGMLIDKGGMPYTDAVDLKPPLIYLINAFTHLFGLWGLWVFERGAVAGATLVLYLVLRRRGYLWPFGQALLFPVLLSLPGIYEAGGYTRIYTSLLSLCGYILLSGTRPRKYLFTGIVLGLVLLTQQETALPLVGWLAVAAVQEGRITPALRGTVGGVGIAVLPLFVWLLVRGALGAFFDQTFGLSLAYVGANSDIAGRVTHFFTALWNTGLTLPLAGAVCVALVFRHTPAFRSLGLPALVALGLQIVALSVSGRLFGHYFLGLVPILSLLLVSGVDGLATQLKERSPRSAIGVLAVYLIFAGVVFGPQYIAYFQNNIDARQAGQTYSQIDAKLAPYLAPVAGQNGQLFVWRRLKRLHLNTDFNITAPTKWVYTSRWDDIPDFDRDGHIFAAMVQDIENAKTRYILDYSRLAPIPRPDLDKQWHAYIAAHYVRVATLYDKGDVLRRK